METISLLLLMLSKAVEKWVFYNIMSVSNYLASQMALVVKNLSANVGD